MSKSGTVYKLCCVDTDIEEIYIGSTKNFNRRKTEHKSMCNNEKIPQYNMYVYQFIRDNGGFSNWSMIQLESVNYETKRDLEAHERRWIELLKPKLNKQLPCRTVKEYQKQYRQENAEKIKQYYQNNIDKMKQYKKQYYQNNIDKIKQINKKYNIENSDNIKEYQKQYFNENADKIKQYKKQYYQNNIDKIKQINKNYRIKSKKLSA
jgi:hypothetical protein